MAGLPPVIPLIDNEPGLQTPADEWASKTTSALNPSDTHNTARDVNPTTAEMFRSESNVTTPGLEMPGSYKVDKSFNAGNVNLQDMAQRASQSVQAAAQTVGEVTASYLPQAASYLPQSVVNTVSPYLPNNNPVGTTIASTNDIPHQTSLPSTEIAGAVPGEKSAGVGALPGKINEEAVPQLPDSRNLTPGETRGVTGYVGSKLEDAKLAAPAVASGGFISQSLSQQLSDDSPHAMPFMKSSAANAREANLPTTEQPSTNTHGGVGSLPGDISEAGVARLPQEKVSLPSQETGFTGATSGVGSLPGAAGEAGVARLPDEKFSREANLPSQESGFAGSASGVGTLPGAKGEEGVARLPDESNIGNARDVVQSPAPMSTKSTTEGADAGAGGVKAEKAPVEKEERKEERKEEHKEIDGEKKEEPKKDMGSSKEGGHKGAPNKGSGYDTDYHPAQMHPSNDKYDDSNKDHDGDEKPNLGATEAQRKVSGPDEQNTNVDQTTGKTDTSSSQQKPSSTSTPHGKEGVSEKANEMSSSHSRGSTGDDSGSPTKKKAGFMEKMKGEAKILLGKMEGKKGAEKVEEGKKMKAGEAASLTSA